MNMEYGIEREKYLLSTSGGGTVQAQPEEYELLGPDGAIIGGLRYSQFTIKNSKERELTTFHWVFFIQDS